MKIHLDPSIAIAADSPTNMMPWNGDRAIMIDRCHFLIPIFYTVEDILRKGETNNIIR